MPCRLLRSWTLALIAAAVAAPALDAGAVARRYTVRPSTSNPTAGDSTEGEDADARAAAVKALGRLNGAVVVVNADTGRVLTIVNQKLALSDGYIPCSTIKLAVGLAALSEGVIEPGEKVRFPGPWTMTVVEATAISNNVLFAELGERLGFKRLRRYARMFGLGEKAGWNIPGEQLGVFPETEHKRGVGRMSSFGDGIRATPLQLAALTAAIANGGKLYYLQHPNSPGEILRFRPRLKRELPIGAHVAEVSEGMRESVRRGTGRNANVRSTVVRGKTGTCSQYIERSGTRLGWFTSYALGQDGTRLAVTVMLRGGGSISGGTASTVAGRFYQDFSRRWLTRLEARERRRRISAQHNGRVIRQEE